MSYNVKVFIYDPSIMLHPNIKNLKAIVTIEGNIGAGKSTVLQILEEYYTEHCGIPIIYVPEPDYTTPITIPPEYTSLVHSPPKSHSLLQSFYTDPYTNSFLFQVAAYCRRCDSIYKKIEHIILSEQEYIVVTERSVISDKEIFTKNLIASNLFPVEAIETYDMFWQQLAGKISTLIKGMIILTVEPQTLLSRISKRNRSAESAISIEYLNQLTHRHQLMADKYTDTLAIAHVEWTTDRSRIEIRDHMILTLQDVINRCLK